MEQFDPLERLMARRIIEVPIKIEMVEGEPIEFTARLKEPAFADSMPIFTQRDRMSEQEFGLRLLGIYLWIGETRMTYERLGELPQNVAAQLAMQCDAFLTRMIKTEEAKKSQKKRNAAAAHDDGSQSRPRTAHDGGATDGQPHVA
jgi:hypothetical protein